MKNLTFFVIVAILFISTSSCQTQRRGVQFHSGDKNTQVIENQASLTGDKKSEYEIQLRRLKRERGNLLTSSKDENVNEIKRLENQTKRLEHQLNDLQNNPQRFEGDRLLSEIEDLESKISENKERLEILYSSDNYPDEAKMLDKKIIQVENFLFDLQLAEDQMLVRMNRQDKLDYFQGDIRNGQEAANAYMLMKWAQEPTTGTAVNSQQQKGELQAVVVNEYYRGVTAVIRHESGLELPDIPLEPKSQTVIDLPFPGEYICYFKRGERTTNIVVKNANPRLLVNYKGDNYAFVLTQRGH